jgi:FixJ family two-component response regulator
LQDRLRRAGRAIPIIFITGHADVAMSVRAMKAGAIEFLEKPFREQELLDAIQVALDRDRANRRNDKEIAALREKWALLTPREREIMPLVASGRLNKQIADDLNLSEITVKVHRAQMLRKLGAKSLQELIRIADRLGLTR